MTAPVVVAARSSDLAADLAGLAERVRSGSGPLLLVADDVHLHPEALADLAEDPRPGTAVLASGTPTGSADLELRGGRVAAVATGAHAAPRASAVLAGAVRVGPHDRPAAAAAVAELAGLARERGWSGDPLGYLVLGLVRRGVRVGAVLLDPWPWARGDGVDAQAVRTQLAAMDPQAVHRMRCRRAGKAEDGFVATFVHRPLSRRLAPVAVRLGLTPNQVTLGSVVVGLAAAATFALGGRGWLVVGAVLLQLSLVIDCVDGDVARYRRMFSPLGAWLDASTDRLKEFACYGGLAWGADAGRTGWAVAAAAVALQTTRHTLDYTFAAVREAREVRGVEQPLDGTGDLPVGAPGPDDGSAARTIALSRRSEAGRPAVVWAKKVLHLGIGERWAVLSVLAALGAPLAAMVVLLGLAALSLLYVAAGLALRGRAWRSDRVPPREREIVAGQVDETPVLGALARRVAGGPDRQGFLWARPAVLRAVELGLLLALTARLPGTAAGGAAFLLLLVTASHLYDLLYRVLGGLRPSPPVVRSLGLGSAGRLVVVAALAVVGGDAGTAGLWVLVAWLGVLFLVVEPAQVLREVRARPDLDPAAEAARA